MSDPRTERSDVVDWFERRAGQDVVVAIDTVDGNVLTLYGDLTVQLSAFTCALAGAGISPASGVEMTGRYLVGDAGVIDVRPARLRSIGSKELRLTLPGPVGLIVRTLPRQPQK
jgi:hypothetical protein